MNSENINLKELEKDNKLSELSIKVLDAQKYKINKNYSSRIQFHPFIYFYYIVDGQARLAIESESIKIKKDDLIIINSNIGHTLYVDANLNSFEFMGFGIESISISKLNSNNVEYPQTNFFNTNLGINNNAKDIFRQIFNEKNSNKVFGNSMANALAAMFIIKMLRKYDDKITVHHERKINRQIDYLKQYIDNNYSDNIKLEELSTMAYMNKFHLISEFKQSYRITPIEYLILKRIEISKNLLISTNHSMEEISAMVGFNSQSYFNQVFKKKCGLTPSQFRKKHRL